MLLLSETAITHVDLVVFFFVKQKTAYEMRISDWSSDVCSSDLGRSGQDARLLAQGRAARDQQRGTGRVPLAGRPLGLCVGGRRVMARRAVLGLFASAAALLLCG